MGVKVSIVVRNNYWILRFLENHKNIKYVVDLKKIIIYNGYVYDLNRIKRFGGSRLWESQVFLAENMKRKWGREEGILLLFLWLY